jgi:Carboxypeptidase regulatory-like domain
MLTARVADTMMLGMFRLFAFTALLFIAATLSAQNAPPHVRGRIMDSSGAVVAGTKITVLRGSEVVAEVVTNLTGDFDLELAAGDYQLEISATDFNPLRQSVRVAAGMAPLALSLTVAKVEQTVEVNDTADKAVTIDSDVALTTQNITGDQLAELPDNEDELVAYLLQLAGTSGAAGSRPTFLIDGFTGGRIPPKEQIQQIIIDNNPFSAEANGGTRITVITRPGTSKWTGQFGGNLNSSAFNAATPGSLTKPARTQETFNSSAGGAIIPNVLTITFTGQYIKTDAEGNAIRAVLPGGQSVNAGVLSPSTRRTAGVRGQLRLTKNQTLNFNLAYVTNDAKNQGAGGFNLAERAFDSSGRNWQAQLSELAILSEKVVNELRFQAIETDNETNAVTKAIAVNVAGAFNSGGAQNDNLSRNRVYQLGDTLRWAMRPKLNLQSGVEGNYERRHSVSRDNFLGMYTFASLADYVAGRPQTFTQTSGNPLLDSQQYEFNAFIQADWRAARNVSVGLGARYIAQSHLHDYNNVAPTVSVAIQAARKTVVRAGSRLSYQTFALSNTETILRNSGGATQTVLQIAFPTYIAGQAPPEAARANSVNAGSIYIRSSRLEAPYNINSLISLEQALPKGWRFAAGFDTTRGQHLIRTRNINAPFPGTPLPEDLLARLNSSDANLRAVARAEVDRLRPYYPLVGNVYQFESSATSFSKNLGIRLYTPTIGLPGTPGTLYLGHFAFGGVITYTRGYSYDDLGIAPNQYDFSREWARSQNDQRNRIQAQFQMRPTATVGLVTFNITSASGRPYSLTTGRDDNGDQSSTDRGAGIGRNTLTSPGTYNIDVTWNKIKTLKPGSRTSAPGSNVGDAQITGGQSGSATQVGRVNFAGPRITWTLSVRNLLNNTQVRSVSGIQTSPLFGKAITFATGRMITAGLSFNF